MCGIFGFVASEEHNASDVIAALKYLEYRGYDSWGIATEQDGAIETQKAVGQIAGATTTLAPSNAALGHTRWATHGGVTEANAHPHTDCAGRLALIHNGIVENHRQLAQGLTGTHSFHSQTDTEVLVHLLEEAVERGEDLLPALLGIFSLVEGLSAVAVLDGKTGEIAAVKNGSPLALGYTDNASYMASDPIALLDYTHTISFLEDEQAALLRADGITVYDAVTGAEIEPEIREVTWDTRRAGLDGYAHFMAKEIHEQPEVLRKLAGTKAEEVSALAGLIRKSRDVYLIGCGTAHHAAMSGRYMLAEIAGRQSTSAVASELNLVLPLLGPDSLLIALSQSGETRDILDAAKAARERGATVAALVNAEGSSLDRFADLSILLDCGPERCVLATKSYTAKLAILQMTAFDLAGKPHEGRQRVLEAAEHVEELLQTELRTSRIKATAQSIADHQHLYILGRHRNYPLALEAALKIKEVTYLHAEGFAAGELKHGVIALVTNGTPCIILAPDKDFRAEVLAAAAEVGARGAYTIGISPAEEEEFSSTLEIPAADSAPYEIGAVCQLLAYEIALLRGCDPDKPRNLAKSVTVK